MGLFAMLLSCHLVLFYIDAVDLDNKRRSRLLVAAQPPTLEIFDIPVVQETPFGQRDHIFFKPCMIFDYTTLSFNHFPWTCNFSALQGMNHYSPPCRV